MSTGAFPRWVNWVGILAAVVNIAKLLTVFQRAGSLAPRQSERSVHDPDMGMVDRVGVLMMRPREATP